MKLGADWDLTEVNSNQHILSLFERRGFLLLRNALHREVIQDIAGRLEQEFNRLNRQLDSLPPELRKSLARSEMPAHDELARFRLEPGNFRHLTSSDFLKQVLRVLCGEEYLWHYPTMFREVSPSKSRGCLPYHQDYSYNTHYPNLMTCWVPLNDCGVDAPGLEVVERNFSESFPHGVQGLWEHGICAKDLESPIKGASVHGLETRAGDVVVFNELTLHRTYLKNGMTRSRFSHDARAVPLRSISPKIRESRKFVSADAPILVTQGS